MTKELSIQLAKCYYDILKARVSIANKLNTKFDSFYEDLISDGMDCNNYDGELFDVNYGNICATITCRNGVIKLVNSVEIWDDEDILYDDYKFEE